MKLNRRYLRSIKENCSFYISSTALTVMTLLLFFLFSITGNALLEFSTDFFERNQVEDAHFYTYFPISEKRVEELEKEYHVVLEPQSYINIENNGITARVFQRTSRLNLYEITEGRDVRQDDEIVISEGFAVENQIQVGASLPIGKSTYRVVGFMQRPDYLYMLENEEDAYKNVTTFYLAYMTEGEFEKLGTDNVQYLVKYTEKTDINAFRRALHEEFKVQSYSGSKDNMRIAMVTEQPELFLLMARCFIFVLPLITVTLICIIIKRKVRSEQKMIGTLSALGYKKSRLMWHYAGFAALPGLLGGVFTLIIALIFSKPFGEAGLMDYEPMRVTGKIRPLEGMAAIVVPTLIYVLAAVLSVRKLLKKDTVSLLNGSAAEKNKKEKPLFAEKKWSFKKKFALRTLLSNPARSLVLMLGVFLGCFVMLCGLGLFDSIAYVSDNAVNSFGTYQYQYVLNELKNENPYGGEPLLLVPMEDEKGTLLSVIGTANDNPYLVLKDEKGESVKPEKGYYLSSLAKYALKLDVGDKITMVNPITMEKTTVTISGIIQNNGQKAVYTSKENAAKLLQLESEEEGKPFFNALVSDKKLNIPDEKIASESRMTDLQDQVDASVAMFGPVITVILSVGILLCLSSVYVSVNMMVTESRGNISMMKVLGYRDRQIDRIVLNVHHVLVPLGILLAIPMAILGMKMFFKLYTAYGMVLLDVHVRLSSFLLAVGLTLLSYIMSLLLLRRKVKNVSMVESLKDLRE